MSDVTNATVLTALAPTLSRLLPQILPPAARAVTLETTSWLVTIRVFVGGPVASAEVYDTLERELEPILLNLGGSQAGPWELHLMLVRQDPPRPVRALGTVVWQSPETTINSLNPP